MEALVFMLTFASIYYAIVWINRYFCRRSHMGNLGREEDYVYYCGYRGGVKSIREKEPDPLPKTELIHPPQRRHPPR
jgi:hypothetical protein